MNNYFEKRFGSNYVKYEGRKTLLLKMHIFNRYKDLFIKTKKNADLIYIDINNIPRSYKLNPNVKIRNILITQKNTKLLEYISNRFDFILDMELRDCIPCTCFNKRDKMSIVYSIFMDNMLLDVAQTSEPGVLDNTIKYIANKYESLGKCYLLEKQGIIKVWAN